MNEGDSMQSFYGSVANGFRNGFSLGVTVSCIKTLFKNVALVPRRQTLRSSAVASAMITSGLMGGVILGTIHGANYSVQVHAVDDTETAMIAGGFVGAMSEIPLYLRNKAGATLTGRSQGMHIMRRRPLFLTKAIVGAHIGGFLYLLLREYDPQRSPRFPQAPAQGNQEGQKLDMCNFPQSLDTVTGDWVTAKPSSGEFLEGEDLH